MTPTIRGLSLRGWALVGALTCSVVPAGGAAQDPTGVPGPDPTQPEEASDTVPVFHNLPAFPDGRGEGGVSAWVSGIWVWDHEELMASGANTLAELFAPVPGVVPLVAGDYGTPAAVSAFGRGAGGVRILRDGFEVPVLEGGVVDLQRVGLAGVERVRLRRDGGRMTVELWSLDHDDPRPFSLIEAGTGDLDNNLFRGAFTAPNALAGSLGVGLERNDSRGATRGETGSRTGSWVRYQLHRGDDAGLALDFRRMGSRSQVQAYPTPMTRTDVALRGRARVAEGVVAELHTGVSSHRVDDERPYWATEGGSVRQHGARVALERDGLWADGAFRLFQGDGLLENRLDLEAGWLRPGVAAVSGHFGRDDWVGGRPTQRGVRGWLEPVDGVVLFGAWDRGGYGASSGPVLAVAPPVADPDAPTPPDSAWVARPDPVLVTSERTTWRAGASLSWRGATVSAAALGLEQDSVRPLGLPSDLGAAAVAGGPRNGWEGYLSIPGPMEGLRITGSYQEWDAGDVYLPRRIYRGGLDYHRRSRETLEWWATAGVRGHDPMDVFVGDEGGSAEARVEAVPFFQSWDARIQVRIVTVRIFVSWENVAVRRNLQVYPDRVLPALRTSYGIRWTMRN